MDLKILEMVLSWRHALYEYTESDIKLVSDMMDESR